MKIPQLPNLILLWTMPKPSLAEEDSSVDHKEISEECSPLQKNSGLTSVFEESTMTIILFSSMPWKCFSSSCPANWMKMIYKREAH